MDRHELTEMIFKICKMCNENKPLSEYYSQEKYSKKRGIYNYFYPNCKSCEIGKNLKWNNENKSKLESYQNKYEKTEKRYIGNLKKKDRGKETTKQWMKNNRNVMRQHNQKRRAKKNELINDFTFSDWNYCLKYFDSECAYCGLSEEDNLNICNKRLEQEHFIPITKNGNYSVNNILPSCRSCNGSKYNHDFLDWYPEQEFYSEERLDKILAYFDFISTKNEIEAI